MVALYAMNPGSIFIIYHYHCTNDSTLKILLPGLLHLETHARDLFVAKETFFFKICVFSESNHESMPHI